MTHLQQLSQQEWEWRCSQTSMRPDYVPRTKFKDDTANSLTKSIITFLKLNNCQAERVSSEGRIIDQRKIVTNVLGQVGMIGSVKRVYGSSKKGTADISATIKVRGVGRSCKFEVKIGKDRMSPAQEAYRDEVESAGGIYRIVRSFDEFIEQYRIIINT